MSEVLQRIREIGIIPVIAIEDAAKAAPLARALANGGIAAAEVTFRTAAGEAAIGQIARECPNVLVGAGTILNTEQCDRALAAGAKFIVSPGYNASLVKHCQELGVPVLPGCVNASDLTRAANAGLKTVKFFPAEQSGGVNGIKALAPVFPGMRFMPTGGVNARNLREYLALDCVVACGGTWMVKKELIEAENWEEITRICAEAVKTMLDFSLQHVGLNCAGEAEADRTARTLCELFGFEYRAGASSIFAAPAVECMKAPYLGTHGHLAIGVSDVERARFQLESRGVEFDDATRKADAKGRLKAIYLRGEFGGFAIHLVQK